MNKYEEDVIRWLREIAWCIAILTMTLWLAGGITILALRFDWF